MKAVDVSNYTAIPTPEQCRCLIDAGFTKAIVGCSYGTVATAQLEAFAASGMDVEAYAFVEFGDGWQAPLDRAIAALTKPVARLWLDCEADPQGDAAVSRIKDAVTYAIENTDLPLGIYTGAWWWKPNTGDSISFSDMPLWTADYREPVGTPTLYGGWTKAAIWQYAGSETLCDLNVDLNVIMEDQMTQQDKEELEAFINGRFLVLIDFLAKQGVVKLPEGK